MAIFMFRIWISPTSFVYLGIIRKKIKVMSKKTKILPMSKEITAEDFLDKISILCNGYNYDETKKDIVKVMEQYAQAKVAEENKRWLNTLDSITRLCLTFLKTHNG